MIKKIISSFIFLALSMPVFAQSYSAIDKMENSMFGMTYSNENNQSRIERLEKSIYGNIRQGDLNSRLNSLSKDLIADEIGKEIEPSKYTEFEDDEVTADNTVDYPLINEFEKKVFKQEFKNKELKQRLSNLEQNIFNKTFSQDDLNTRTDRLKTAIQINQKPIEVEDYSEYFAQMPQSEFTYNNPAPEKKLSKKYDANVVKILNALEKKILKKTYPNQDEESRIERLEENIFNTSFPQDSMESRLERLALAYQATKTSKKYDTNKFSQHMSTAMQVGVFLLMILAMVL